ncbi:MAG: glycosyl hydrolase family 65 protein, partial [Sphaerochaetaceae bacterium]
EASVSTMNNSFRYYEKITTHDSSLSACIFSIVASRLGLADKAYDYFNNSMEIDLSNTHGNTKDGLHMANMGGSYLAIVFGFAGLRIKDEGAFLSPTIPEVWKGYRFNIKLRASILHVQVNQRQVNLRLQNPAAPATSTSMVPGLFLYGEPIEVSEDIKSFPLKPRSATALLL